MEKHPIKIIFFDLYQTLLDVDLSVNNPNHEIEGWDIFAKTLLKYDKKVSGLEFQKLYTKRRDDFYSDKSRKTRHHNLFEITSDVLREDLGLNLSKEEITELIYIYRKASRGHLRLYPGVFGTLSYLSKEYILSTASHTQGSFTQLELRELNIEQFFSYFVYSSDIGFRKESTEFYKRALEIVGEVAADCLMVGDNYDVDVVVPQKLGIRGIWIKNPITASRYPMEQEPLDTLNLENFGKLPELIEKTKLRMDENQIAVSTYNKIARQYAAVNFDDSSNFPYVDKFLLRLSKNSRVLDVGCGPGNLVKYVLSRGYEAEGIDLSEKMIEIAREKVPEGKFTLMDMHRLDYGDALFDGVTAIFSLIHIPSTDIADVLKEFNRILKLGGFVLLIVQKGEADKVVNEPFDEKEKMFINFFNREKLTKFLTTGGFKIIEQTEVQTPAIHGFTKSDTIICMIAEKVSNTT